MNSDQAEASFFQLPVSCRPSSPHLEQFEFYISTHQDLSTYIHLSAWHLMCGKREPQPSPLGRPRVSLSTEMPTSMGLESDFGTYLQWISSWLMNMMSPKSAATNS